MQDDANKNCEMCQGEGEVYGYFANHKDKYVIFNWQYCIKCFPYSSGCWPYGENIVEINSHEFDRLMEKESYSDYTGH